MFILETTVFLQYHSLPVVTFKVWRNLSFFYTHDFSNILSNISGILSFLCYTVTKMFRLKCSYYQIC